jgi:hypothetical protein
MRLAFHTPKYKPRQHSGALEHAHLRGLLRLESEVYTIFLLLD